METPLNLAAELERYSPRSASFDPTVLVYEDATPAHSFTRLVAPLRAVGYLIVSARDHYFPRLAENVIQFTRSRVQPSDLRIVARLLDGFHDPDFAFEKVLLIGPSAHRMFQTLNSALHDITLEACPVYAGEFSGEEKPEIIDLVRRTVVPTLDWTRQPSPQVYVRFNDAAADVRSTGKKPGLTSKSDFLRTLMRMLPAKGSFVEATNAKGEVCRFVPTQYGVEVVCPGPGDPVVLSRDGLTEWVDEFLGKGLQVDHRVRR